MKKIDKKRLNELRLIFLKGFLSHYNLSKRRLLDLNKQFELTTKSSRDQGHYIARITIETVQSINSCHQLLDKCEGELNEDIAKNLGYALGIFIAAIEYGFVSKGYNKTENFFYLVGYIAKSLKRLNKSVTNKFITNRLKKIASRNADSLDREKIDLLIKMGKLFR